MKFKDNFSNGLSNLLAAAGASSGDPNITMLGDFFSPYVADIITDIASRTLSSLQTERLCDAIKCILKKSGFKISSGKSFRQDPFMTENEGEQAKQVLEGILLNINDEYERKKIEYHANFFTNLCFEERLLFEQAIAISKLIKTLSYRQLVIMAYTKDERINTTAWIVRFKDFHYLAKYGDFYSELVLLENYGILQQDCQGHAFGGAPLKLSDYGEIIYQEINLSEIPSEEKTMIRNIVNDINRAINGR